MQYAFIILKMHSLKHLQKFKIVLHNLNKILLLALNTLSPLKVWIIFQILLSSFELTFQLKRASKLLTKK